MPNEPDETAEYTIVDQNGMQVEVVETTRDVTMVWGATKAVVSPRCMTVRTAIEAVLAGFKAEAIHIATTGTRNEADPGASVFLDSERACEIPHSVWDAYHRAMVRHNERAYV